MKTRPRAPLALRCAHCEEELTDGFSRRVAACPPCRAQLSDAQLAAALHPAPAPAPAAPAPAPPPPRPRPRETLSDDQRRLLCHHDRYRHACRPCLLDADIAAGVQRVIADIRAERAEAQQDALDAWHARAVDGGPASPQRAAESPTALLLTGPAYRHLRRPMPPVTNVPTGNRPLLLAAAELVIDRRYANTGLLTRRLRTKYGTAVQLLNLLKQAGVIGHATAPTHNHDVLIAAEDKTAALAVLAADPTEEPR